jgi:hypothetical protein
LTPVRIAFYGLLVFGATRFAATFLGAYALAAALAQAVIAEWGAGRIGIAWSDPAQPPASAKAVAVRALRGAGMGLGAAGVVLGVALATRAARLEPNTPSLAVILVGAIAPACFAARDELLLRGLVLHVATQGRAGLSQATKLAFCGLASAAAAWGDGTTAPPALLSSTLCGMALGALWLRDRGAWMAWGAHAVFVWASGPLLKGGLLDVRSSPGAWGGGDMGLANAWAGVVALGAVCIAAILFAKPANPASRSPADGSARLPSKSG